MDVEAHLEQIEQLVAEGRPVPLSSLVMVNRHDVEDLVAEARTILPEELRQARWVLKERDEVLEEANRQADVLRADARAESERLVSETEVVRAAQREAERVLSEASERARTLRLEAEDYVDAKLAAFQAVLDRTLEEVERGRERLREGLGDTEPGGDRPLRPVAAAPGAMLFDQERVDG